MRTLWTVAGICLVLFGLAGPARAQDEGGEEDAQPELKPWLLWFQAEAWVAQPAGLEYRPGIRYDPSAVFKTQPLEFTHDPSLEFRYTLGFGLPSVRGAVVFIYYGHTDQSTVGGSRPGEFVFGETTTAPFLPGVFNDGTADTFSSEANTKLQDLRLDYWGAAFETRRVEGRWFAGYRRLTHNREMITGYTSVAANLPPLIPPAVDPPRFDLMIPLPDTSTITSEYEGRGLEAGFATSFELLNNRIWLDTELGLAVLRGKMNTTYESLTHFYGRLTPQNTLDEVIEPPYDVLDDPLDPSDPSQGVVADFVDQIGVAAGIRTVTESASSEVLDLALGFRWRAWKGLEVTLGFRSTHYDNVGWDVVPTDVVLQNGAVANPNQRGPNNEPLFRVNTLVVERTAHSVDYEGFYLGIGYKY